METIHVYYFPHSVQISQKCQKVYVTITTAALLTRVPHHLKKSAGQRTNTTEGKQTADQNTELAVHLSTQSHLENHVPSLIFLYLEIALQG